jgi:hypothetical protein
MVVAVEIIDVARQTCYLLSTNTFDIPDASKTRRLFVYVAMIDIKYYSHTDILHLLQITDITDHPLAALDIQEER